jgi:hypothetical protein
VRYYLEQRDPDFAEKMAEVLCVYRQVKILKKATASKKATEVAIISYDEKPGIQAIATTAPGLPPEPGVHATFAREFEYKRHGTVSLLATDLLEGFKQSLFQPKGPSWWVKAAHVLVATDADEELFNVPFWLTDEGRAVVCKPEGALNAVAAFRLDQGIQLRFVASNRADLHVLGDEAPRRRPAKAGPDPENERCLTCCHACHSYKVRDLISSKT